MPAARRPPGQAVEQPAVAGVEPADLPGVGLAPVRRPHGRSARVKRCGVDELALELGHQPPGRGGEAGGGGRRGQHLEPRRRDRRGEQPVALRRASASAPDARAAERSPRQAVEHGRPAAPNTAPVRRPARAGRRRRRGRSGRRAADRRPGARARASRTTARLARVRGAGDQVKGHRGLIVAQPGDGLTGGRLMPSAAGRTFRPACPDAAMPLCFIEPKDAIRVIAESVGREARRQLLGELVRAWVDEIPERGAHVALRQGGRRPRRARPLAARRLARLARGRAADRQQGVPRSARSASLGDNRREALKIAAGLPRRGGVRRRGRRGAGAGDGAALARPRAGERAGQRVPPDLLLGPPRLRELGRAQVQERSAQDAGRELREKDTLGIPLGPGIPRAFLRALGEREDWTALRVSGALVTVGTGLLRPPGARPNKRPRPTIRPPTWSRKRPCTGTSCAARRTGVEDVDRPRGGQDRRRPDAQRRAAAGDEGGRRQVRRRRADPAVRAPVGRGDEARRRPARELPRQGSRATRRARS